MKSVRAWSGVLINFVSDRVANGPFEHHLCLMRPCCEPAEHRPMTILVIAVKHLGLFEGWPCCRGVRVEHGADGSRVLILMELVRRFKAEQAGYKRARPAPSAGTDHPPDFADRDHGSEVQLHRVFPGAGHRSPGGGGGPCRGRPRRARNGVRTPVPVPMSNAALPARLRRLWSGMPRALA